VPCRRNTPGETLPPAADLQVYRLLPGAHPPGGPLERRALPWDRGRAVPGPGGTHL